MATIWVWCGKYGFETEAARDAARTQVVDYVTSRSWPPAQGLYDTGPGMEDIVYSGSEVDDIDRPGFQWGYQCPTGEDGAQAQQDLQESVADTAIAGWWQPAEQHT